MSDHPSAPFGENTIEGAFLDDVGYCFDNDESVDIRVNGNDAKQIDVCNLELGREQIDTTVMNGTEHAVVEMIYILTVPVELAVSGGDDVKVSGFEATWTFNDVSVEQINDESTTVSTKRMGKSYGTTGTPNAFE